MPPLSIPARTFRLIPAKAYDGKITPQAIPPPPPYHASVRNAIHRNEINQITTQIQQSCSRNTFNVSTTSSSSSSTVTTNINAANSAVYVDQNSMKQSTRIEMDIGDSDHMQMGEIITADDFDAQNDVNIPLELENSTIFSGENRKSPGRSVTISAPPQKQAAEQVKDKNVENLSADTSTATTSPATTRTTTTTTTTAATTSDKELRNSVKQEVTDSSTMDTENTSSEKRANGLKVISNVQVSPNAILNVSLNSTASETNSLNNMIIVSSLPSTSTGITTSQQQQASLPQLSKPQSLLKNVNESRTSSETRNSKQTKGSVEVSIKIIDLLNPNIYNFII